MNQAEPSGDVMFTAVRGDEEEGFITVRMLLIIECDMVPF